ncbi:MAG: NAD(+) kinase [Gammaproteobacteria bacterium]|nr:NAD(+) kinase [Gammaproteobacteria bacterium]
MRKKAAFSSVVLYARQHRANQNVSETLERLISYLKSKKVSPYLDVDTAAHFTLNCPVLERKKMKKPGTLIVVVGGDGSLLSAARMAIHVDVPVIGINRGHLGFLTDILPQVFESALGDVLSGYYIQEKRSLLQLRFSDESKKTILGDALNDIVLSRGTETHLVRFDIYINEQFVSHYRADGLIFSTPTGSTAYALSAGGPIMHPDLQALVMVPMFSHSLNARPLVIDANAEVRLHISEHNEAPLQLSCDGHNSFPIKPGTSVIIEKNPRTLELLHPKDYHYYDTLRVKLGWGSKPEG